LLDTFAWNKLHHGFSALWGRLDYIKDAQLEAPSQFPETVRRDNGKGCPDEWPLGRRVGQRASLSARRCCQFGSANSLLPFLHLFWGSWLGD